MQTANANTGKTLLIAKHLAGQDTPDRKIRKIPQPRRDSWARRTRPLSRVGGATLSFFLSRIDFTESTYRNRLFIWESSNKRKASPNRLYIAPQRRAPTAVFSEEKAKPADCAPTIRWGSMVYLYAHSGSGEVFLVEQLRARDSRLKTGANSPVR